MQFPNEPDREHHDHQIGDKIERPDRRERHILTRAVTRKKRIPVFCKRSANQEDLKNTASPIGCCAAHTDPRKDSEILRDEDSQIEEEVGELGKNHGIIVDDLVDDEHLDYCHGIIWRKKGDMLSHSNSSIVELHGQHAIRV